jgi:hypothetical protein
MKEKIINSIKRIKPRSVAYNQIILCLIFLSGISLSILRNGLFIKEQIIVGFIVLFALISAQSTNKYNQN